MDTENICRLCLSFQDTGSVFLILNENKTLVDLIFQFLEIEIVPDSLEDYYLCFGCHNVLQAFNEFKTKCNKNDIEFRSRYQFKQSRKQESESKSENRAIQSETHSSKTQNKNTDKQSKNIANNNVESNSSPKDSDTIKVQNKTIKKKTWYKRDRQKIPCHMCGKLVSKASYTVHVSLHDANSQRFPCQICDRSYKQRHNLTKHLNTHTKKVLFPCEEANCGKIFDLASTLRKHHKIMHTDIRDHICNICGRGFAIPSGLSAHMRAHSSEKKHACAECGKLFKTPGEVRLHSKVHTGRDPYVCPECSKAFPKASMLKSHRAEEHSFPNIAILES